MTPSTEGEPCIVHHNLDGLWGARREAEAEHSASPNRFPSPCSPARCTPTSITSAQRDQIGSESAPSEAGRASAYCRRGASRICNEKSRPDAAEKAKTEIVLVKGDDRVSISSMTRTWCRMSRMTHWRRDSCPAQWRGGRSFICLKAQTQARVNRNRVADHPCLPGAGQRLFEDFWRDQYKDRESPCARKVTAEDHFAADRHPPPQERQCCVRRFHTFGGDHRRRRHHDIVRVRSLSV